MGRGEHLLTVGVLIQLLIFIEGPQVGGDVGSVRAETKVSGHSIKDESGDDGVRRVDVNVSSISSQPVNVNKNEEIPVGGVRNITRSKLWSPYSTVSSLLGSTTIYEDQQPPQQQSNQKSSLVNQTPQQSYQSQGPLISNIRHYKSRKSFSRVKTTSTSGPQLSLVPLQTKTESHGEKIEIEHHDHHDWQGDEAATGLAIPTAKQVSSKNNRNETDDPGPVPLQNDTSVLYGEPRFTPGATTTTERKVRPGLMGNFTKIDQIKTFLSQHKNTNTSKDFSPTPKGSRTTTARPETKNIINYTQTIPQVVKLSENVSDKQTHQNTTRNNHNTQGRDRRRKLKTLRRKHVKDTTTASSQYDYQSGNGNTGPGSAPVQNFDEYYEIGQPVARKTSINGNGNGNDDPIYVPGVFPSFYEEEDIKNGDVGVVGVDSYEEVEIIPQVEAGVIDPEEPEEKAEMDVVSKFLRIIEERTPENCTAGVNLTLGEGVVDRYAQDRFRMEAEVAVNRANMLTRLWKYAPHVMESEYLLHASLFSIIEFDDDIFAAGNCYDAREYKHYRLFCPFAHRLPEGDIVVKDLAIEYDYLGNTSEFFFAARINAQRIISSFNQFRKGYHHYPYNDTTYSHSPERYEDIILNVTYEDGKWSMPYFDCGGGNIWMMTYTVPFFGYRNSTYYFKGTSGIDIDLRRVDIDQCPVLPNSTELNIFASSDKCKKATTKCAHTKGLGFRRGSYTCECRPGFYFPNISSPIKYFNGTLLEEEYENKFMRKSSRYDEKGAFECLPCPSGCDVCEDDRPCVLSLNWLMRTGILILQSAIILMLPLVGLFTWKYSEVKVVRAASPLLLRFIVLGAFFIYCTTLVMYPSPSVITCTLQVWLREIGFSLAYGALMLKTWRISVIFRVRSAKAVKITDADLMKRLGMIAGSFTVLLAIRTLVAPPVSIVSYTSDGLKAWLCKSDWWDHSFTIMELLFLVWGIRLCIVVRKAPSEFNESKFISLAIYNEFLLSLFLNISMLFLQSPANPDLLYIIFFCHVQLTMTLLLCLIFGSKAYMVFRGHGKGGGSDESRVPTNKFINKGRPGQSATSAQNSTGMNCRFNASISTGHEQISSLKVPEDVQDEFRRLYAQLEELKERNMRLGNRHLVAKITAMQAAADNMLCTGTTATSTATTTTTTTTTGAQHKQIAVIAGSSGTNSLCPSTKNIPGPSITSQGGSTGSSSCSSTSNPKGKSMEILSDISEDENPSSSSRAVGATAEAETKRLGTCQAPDKADADTNAAAATAAGPGAMKRSILQKSTSTTSESSARVTQIPLKLPIPNLGPEDTQVTPVSSEGEERTIGIRTAEMTSPSENEVQVGDDDELLDRDLDIEDDEVQVTLVTNPDSHTDCDNEEGVLDEKENGSHCRRRRNLKTSAKGSSQVEEPGEKQNHSLPGILEQPQDPSSASTTGKSQGPGLPPTTTTTTTGESSSPSKIILDLNDKSRFTEEITV